MASRTRQICWMAVLALGLALVNVSVLNAQSEGGGGGSAELSEIGDSGGDSSEEGGGSAGEEGKTKTRGGFVDIMYGGSVVNLLIWILIWLTSAAVIALVIDGILALERSKLMPEELVEGVRSSLNEGDLDAAVENCENYPGPLSTILMAGFSNITEGYDVIQQTVSSSAEIENEKLMQRVNYLSLCGQIAPMLGLLGTVTGMVRAFAGMAQASGAGQAEALALSISTALWTTCCGLLIAVPALVAYAFMRNRASRIVLEMEATVLDLIKVLRNAEVEEGEEEEEEEEEE